MGGWSWPDRLADSIWSQGYGGGSNRLLSLVGEWPEIRSKFAGRMLAGDGGSKHFLKVLRQLVDLRLVSRTGGQRGRYRLSSRGYWVMASRDRVPNNVMLAVVQELHPGAAVHGHWAPEGECSVFLAVLAPGQGQLV